MRYHVYVRKAFLWCESIDYNMQIRARSLLAYLHDNELKLNAGRFKHFSHDVQQYSINLNLNNLSGINIPDYVKQHLNWVAEHAKDAWNVHVNDQNDLVFSFAEADIAILFKFVWQ